MTDDQLILHMCADLARCAQYSRASYHEVNALAEMCGRTEYEQRTTVCFAHLSDAIGLAENIRHCFTRWHAASLCSAMRDALTSGGL